MASNWSTSGFHLPYVLSEPPYATVPVSPVIQTIWYYFKLSYMCVTGHSNRRSGVELVLHVPVTQLHFPTTTVALSESL